MRRFGGRREEAGNWKGGKTKVNGYLLTLMPDHPYANSTGYVRSHRLVMGEKIGRRLTPKEYVHHINGDKEDNRPENLQIMSPSEHCKHHAPLKYLHKLNPEEVIAIRLHAKEGMTRKSLAEIFGVCRSNIDSIINLRSWRNV